ncbi:MAG: hypothetical protein B0A82_02330 [Alkalinema sp. CACIAM 70d]|nr:MAG: hypothetical protein B0A82_02330 [Alkalinema sp. CACIAM 70d]
MVPSIWWAKLFNARTRLVFQCAQPFCLICLTRGIRPFPNPKVPIGLPRISWWYPLPTIGCILRTTTLRQILRQTLRQTLIKILITTNLANATPLMRKTYQSLLNFMTFRIVYTTRGCEKGEKA